MAGETFLSCMLSPYKVGKEEGRKWGRGGGKAGDSQSNGQGNRRLPKYLSQHPGQVKDTTVGEATCAQRQKAEF